MDLMDTHQLNAWMEFYTLEPWGPRREDLRAGLIASWIRNTNVTGGSPLKAGDFFEYPGENRDMTVEEWMERKETIKSRLRALKHKRQQNEP